MASTHGERRAAYAAWITVCLIWGTTFLGIRIALETMPPALLAGLRSTAAGVVLAIALRTRGQRLPAMRQWGGLILLGLLMLAVGNGLVVWAEQWVPSGIAAVTVSSSPFWMAGIEASLPGGERLTGRTVAGLCVGFAGIVLLVWPELTAGGAGGRQFLVGMVALQIACVGWSLGSSYVKRHAPEGNGLASSALQMLFGGLIMLGVGTIAGEWRSLYFTGRTLAAELYLTVVGSVIGYSAYVYALKHLPVSTVSLYAFINPVIAVLLGALLADEPMGPRVVGAAALVLAGVSIVRRGPRPAAPNLVALHDSPAAHQSYQEQDNRDHE